MPFKAGRDGGSGRCSTTEKRKASGQLVKEVIFEGERVLGSSSSVATGVIKARLREGWVKSSDHRLGHHLDLLEGPEVPEPGQYLEAAVYEAVHQEF